MAADASAGRTLQLTGLAALIAAVLAALLWNPVPLEVPRPFGSAIRTQGATIQDVDARLWEDPFAAVSRDPMVAALKSPKTAEALEARKQLSSDGAGKHSLSGLCEAITRGTTGELTLFVLGVAVSNAPYSDGDERRRRIRYAVQSAFNVAHFVPDDAQHVGFFTHTEDDNDPTILVVPFELLKRKNVKSADWPSLAPTRSSEARQDAKPPDPQFRVLLLWLEEEWLTLPKSGTARPLSRIGVLRDRLAQACGLNPANSRALQFSILGPASSDTLRVMVHELKRWDRQGEGRNTADRRSVRDISFYSAFATASERDLLQLRQAPRCGETRAPPAASKLGCSSPAACAEPACTVAEQFNRHFIRFHRTTATDENLSRALARELQFRGVEVDPRSKSSAHVALISEWDSYYGRMLPKAVMRAVGSEEACETDPTEPTESAAAAGTRHGPLERDHCWIHRYSYLRGLDGQAPAAGPEGKESAVPGDGTLQKGALPFERAEGPKQFDYLRRLAQGIDRRNRQLASDSSHTNIPCGGEVCAVGVLGSDVYDKIAVLRALRRELPRAVFFTTDLDARLLQSSEYDWTRNLIVVSSFGLELAPCLQKNTPPFRSTYQTAAYFATQLAAFQALPAQYPGRDVRCPDGFGLGVHGEAAGAEANLEPIEARLARWLDAPRVYEIGRTQAVDLSATESECVYLGNCASIHPPLAAAYWSGRTKLALVLVAVLGLAGLVSIRRIRRLVCECGAFFGRALLRERRVGPRTLEIAVPEKVRPVLRGRGQMAERVLVLAVGLAILLVAVWLAADVRSALRVPLNQGGEPFAWLEGISIWPTELIRALATALSLVFLTSSFKTIRDSDRNLNASLLLNQLPHMSDTAPGASWWNRLFGRLVPPEPAPGRPAPSGAELPAEGEGLGILWRQYQDAGVWYWAMARAFLLTAALLGMGWGLMEMTGYPGRPVRGAAALALDTSMMWVAGISFLLLLSYVLFTIRLCARFIDGISDKEWPTDWPKETLDNAGAPFGLGAIGDAALRKKVLGPWTDILVVAERTKVIGPLIYYPFLVLALLVVARWPVFDNWSTPIGLVAVFGLSFTIACMGAFVMQRTATRARAVALDELQEALAQRSRPGAQGEPTADQIRALLDRVRNLRTGAFLPFFEQPAVRAALLPFGSAGLLQLIDVFKLAS